MIKNIVLDFGKVLVDYDFERFFRKFIPDPQRSLQVAMMLCNSTIIDQLDRESKPFDEVMEDVIRVNQSYEKEIRLFSAHYPELIIGEIEGMKTLLQQLKQEGYKLYGLTNWCTKVYLTMKEYDIFQLLDGYVISSEVHFIKPEPEIYQCLFDKFQLNPQECVFTDDKEVNIEGAQRVGMQGIVFRDTKQFEHELRALIASNQTV